MLKLYYNFDYKNILTLDERIDRKEIFTAMNNLTTEEQQRLWKLDKIGRASCRERVYTPV